jgi:hypothetical protein
MLDLDEQFEAATRELHAHLDSVHLAPASAVIRRRNRRRYTISAFALVIAAVGVITIGRAATHDTHTATFIAGSAHTVEDRLLFPTQISTGKPEVVVGPALPDGAQGLVHTPSGALFHISVMADSGQLTPNVDRRQINGRTFIVEHINGLLAYSSLDNCARVRVEQSDPSAAAWNADATALLTALTIDGQHATVTLPAGWESLGVGHPGTLLQVGFKTNVGNTTHAVSLMQMPDSPLAVLPDFGAGPITPTTFNGHAAWAVNLQRNSGPFTSLIWDDNGTAVSLHGPDVSLDDLKTIASGLQHNKADEWARYLQSATFGGPSGTAPSSDTVNQTNCGPSQLTISH